MKRAILFVFIALTIALHLSSASGHPGGAAPSSRDVVPFRLLKAYLILVDCSVVGHSGLTAVVDTGTTETVLDVSLVRRLALPVQPDSATSLATDSPALAVSISDLEIGPLRVQHLDGISMDLSQIGAQLGIRPDVVVGMDVLHQQDFTIDYASHAIRFGPQPALAHTAVLRTSNRFLLVDSLVLGQSATLKLDTGFNGLLLYGNRVGGLARLVSAQAPVGGVSGVAQASAVRNVSSAEVRVGNWRATGLPVAIMEKGPSGVDFYDGLLGPAALHAKRVACDFEHHLLSWE